MGFVTEDDIDRLAAMLTGRALTRAMRDSVAVFAASMARDGAAVSIRSDGSPDEGRLVVTIHTRTAFRGAIRIDGRAPFPDDAEDRLVMRLAAE